MERHKDDDFALLGINTGDAEEAFREGCEQLGVTWLCTWQGEGSNPIAETYGVNAYPTTVVLDRKGVIRAWNALGEDLEAKVTALIAEED